MRVCHQNWRGHSAPVIHEPGKLSLDEQRRYGAMIGMDYPAPIVDHATQRALALAMYREAGEAHAPSAAEAQTSED